MMVKALFSKRLKWERMKDPSIASQLAHRSNNRLGQEQTLTPQRQLDERFRSGIDFIFSSQIICRRHGMKRASSYMVVGACLFLAATGLLKQANSQPADWSHVAAGNALVSR
jgi:hypothetical protein